MIQYYDIISFSLDKCANNYGQLVILENDIPGINYRDANEIRFTKYNNVGRAGLLYDPN